MQVVKCFDNVLEITQKRPADPSENSAIEVDLLATRNNTEASKSEALTSEKGQVMAWFGKIIGGTVGLMIGGPIGAISGIALGHHFIDDPGEGVVPAGGGNFPGMSQNEQLHAIFFITTFSLLAKLAKADGVVSESEIKVVDDLITRDMQMTGEARSYAIKIFQSAKNSPHSFEQFATQFYQHFSGQRQLLQSMIDLLLRVAAADGEFHPEEERLVLSAVRIFKISKPEYEAAKARHIEETDKYYAMLRSKPNDSDEKIKKNYRKLVNEFHPDKIESKGLPPEFSEFAKVKFQEIQAAYEAVSKERGIK